MALAHWPKPGEVEKAAGGEQRQPPAAGKGGRPAPRDRPRRARAAAAGSATAVEPWPSMKPVASRLVASHSGQSSRPASPRVSSLTVMKPRLASLTSQRIRALSWRASGHCQSRGSAMAQAGTTPRGSSGQRQRHRQRAEPEECRPEAGAARDASRRAAANALTGRLPPPSSTRSTAARSTRPSTRPASTTAKGGRRLRRLPRTRPRVATGCQLAGELAGAVRRAA